MSNYYIFEDKTDTPSSILLRQDKFVGKYMLFSEGNQLLEDKLNSVYNTEDFFYVFIDFVPDNKHLIVQYEGLKDTIINEYGDNVALIPIPCIELFILKMLFKYGYVTDNVIYEKAILNFDKNFVHSLPKNFGKLTLERCYKYILNVYLDKEFHNKSKNGIGSFYKSENLLYKSEALYVSLFFFHIRSPEHKSFLYENFDINSIVFLHNTDLYNILVNYYNDLFTIYGMNGASLDLYIGSLIVQSDIIFKYNQSAKTAADQIRNREYMQK